MTYSPVNQNKHLGEFHNYPHHQQVRHKYIYSTNMTGSFERFVLNAFASWRNNFQILFVCTFKSSCWSIAVLIHVWVLGKL